MSPDPSSLFHRVLLTDQEFKQARQVNPYFLAHLKNKLADAAEHLVRLRVDYSPDPATQVKAIVEIEKARQIVEVYDELISEIVDSDSGDSLANS